MVELNELSAVEAARRIKSGDLTAEALMRACLERVAERDEVVRAWAHLDPGQAIAGAKSADAAGNPGPLAGIPVAVKDIIDTADMPTRHGSTIYGVNRPNADAAVVTQTRQQGGVVMGKTVTTEFAWRNPGPTGNPHNAEHTPGGSSSGAAAAVDEARPDPERTPFPRPASGLRTSTSRLTRRRATARRCRCRRFAARNPWL